MIERLLNMAILLTLSLAAFMLVVFGFEWIYQLWLADVVSEQWVMPFLVIPTVAALSAVLLYLFVRAMGSDEDALDTHSSATQIWRD